MNLLKQNREDEFDEPEIQEVVIYGINMPFWSIVGFMVKVALASIPAYLILMVLGALVYIGFLVLVESLGGGY